MHMKKFQLTFILVFVISFWSFAQMTSDKITGTKDQAYLDSMKNAEYPHLLPIWGRKAIQKGYKLQYPGGLSINYLGQKSDLIIDNLEIGFNNGEKHNLDEIIRFKSAEATTN